MIFNLASAALIVEQYNQTGTVTYTNYALSLTDLVLLCIILPCSWRNVISRKNLNIFLISIPLFLNVINNIVYSGFVIHFYNKNLSYNENFIYYSIAILVTNSLDMLGCFSIYEIMNKEEK